MCNNLIKNRKLTGENVLFSNKEGTPIIVKKQMTKN